MLNKQNLRRRNLLYKRVYEMERKQKVMEALRDFGVLSTTKLSAICGMRADTIKKVLEKLLVEKRIKNKEDVRAMHWELDMGMEHQYRFTPDGGLILFE